MAVSVALFCKLPEAGGPRPPASAVATAPRERGGLVPPDVPAAYRETHVDAPEGAAVPLPAHVAEALSSRGVDAPNNAARRAVVDASDPEGTRRAGAAAATAAAAERGLVAVGSTCVVPERAHRALRRADLRDAVDCVVTGVSSGRHNPDPRISETVARHLAVPVADLVHVGTDPETDGGVAAGGSRFPDARGTPLSRLAAHQEAAP
jgi:FMN phosphatase YigB (HAD superfamily)